MRIDAHQHYWRIGRNGHSWPTADWPRIHRDFGPEDLAPLLAARGIARTVLVQSQPHVDDTAWMLELAAETETIGAVVGWVPFRDADAADRIHALADRAKLRGIRPMLQDLSPGWILDDTAQPALRAMAERGLVFDALIRPQHLADIGEVAARYPNLAIVVDHAAKPDIRGGVREPWATDIAALAHAPNVTCKLSGLVTEAASDWSPDDLAFYVTHLLGAFGPDRLLWGSDWPVCLLAAEYDTWLDTAETLLTGCSDAERAAIFGGNAARLYRINFD
jgi:L-fuconolactonase